MLGGAGSAVLVAIAVLIPSVALRADQATSFPITIHLSLDASITSTVIKNGLEDEATRIWRPYGIRLEWSDGQGSPDRSRGVALEVVVERQPHAHAQTGASVLGVAVLHGDEPRPGPIRISFDATREVLMTRMSRPVFLGVVHQHELARALGRVLAHEIGHALLCLPSHDAAGLMRAVLSPEELADPDRSRFRLTERSVGRLRSRVAVLAALDGADPDRRGSLTVPE